jgi:hypothetical protein
MAPLFLILVFYLSWPPELVVVGVAWHLHRNGFAWTTDGSEARTLHELAVRTLLARLARRALAR